MYLYHLTDIQVIAFSLVLLRVLAFFIAMPVFGILSVPVPVKILASLVVALLIFPVTPLDQLPTDGLDGALVFITIREILVGLSMGWLTRMLFFAVGIGGQLISLAMGLANAQLYNPMMGSQSSTVEQFQTTLVSLFFFAVNGHHYFLMGLRQSFDIVPLAPTFFSTTSMTTVIGFTGEIILVGLKLSMPVMLAILLMNVAMGVIGRAVPQINVLITSLPLNVLLGFVVLIASLPLYMNEIGGTLDMVAHKLFHFMKVI